MLTATSLGKKNLLLLGKLLISQRPEVAHELLSTYGPPQSPVEHDVSKIDQIYQSYCRIRSIEPHDYTGALYKSSKVDVRRVFIAVVLHIYNPQVFHQPLDSIIVNIGLVKKLSEVFQQDNGNMSKTIRKVIAWERQYEDFALIVNQIIEQITANGCTQG